MKKSVINFFLLLISSYSCFSQSLCAPGATWHYKDIVIFSSAYRNGITELKHTNTATINSIVCCEIAVTFTGQFGGPTGPVGTYTYPPMYVYGNNSVYYLYDSDSNTFDTIVNFNASIGDKWTIPIVDCSSKPTLTVTDTGHVFINSQFLRKVVVQRKEILSGLFIDTDTIIEKIGGINHFFAPWLKCIADGPRKPDFICYRDDNFQLYKKYNVHNCFYDVGINELASDKGLLKIYHNPASDKLKFTVNIGLTSTSVVKFIIYNTLGQILKELELTDNSELDVSEIKNGIYIAYLINNEDFYKTKFVISR